MFDNIVARQGGGAGQAGAILISCHLFQLAHTHLYTFMFAYASVDQRVVSRKSTFGRGPRNKTRKTTKAVCNLLYNPFWATWWWLKSTLCVGVCASVGVFANLRNLIIKFQPEFEFVWHSVACSVAKSRQLVTEIPQHVKFQQAPQEGRGMRGSKGHIPGRMP